MIPRGIRNNNPGNIIQSSIPWQGKETPSRDPRFESFKTPEDGLRALCKLLLSYEDKYGLRTVRGIINRWAPPVENDTSAYVVAVAQAVGVAPDTTISTHDPATLTRLTLGIVQHENGQQPYTSAQIAAAVASALGKSIGAAPVTPVVSPAPAPTPRKSMDPLTLSLFGTIVQSLPDIFKAFGKGDSPKAAVVQRVAEVATAALGVGGPGAALDALKGPDAEANIAKVAEAVKADPALSYALIEVGGGVAGAQAEYAQINKDYDDDPAWRIAMKFLFNPVHWVTGVFLFYVQQFMPALAKKVEDLDGAAAMGLIVIVFGVIALVGTRWLGAYVKQQKE